MAKTSEDLLRRARSGGYLLVRHPEGSVEIPGFGRMPWSKLAIALSALAERSEPVGPADLLDLATEVRSLNESLPLELRGQAFTSDAWDSTSVSIMRNGRLVRLVRHANDPDVLLDVLIELSRDFGP